MTTLEQLSDHLIQILRQLSAQKRPLTAANLCEALTRNGGIVDLQARISVESNSGSREPFQPPAEIEAAYAQLKDFTKRLLPTLILLVQVSNSKPLLHDLLDRLRVMVLEDADPSLMEDCVQQIREVLWKEELNPGTPPKAVPCLSSRLGSWLRSSKPDGARDPILDLSKIQPALMRLMNPLQALCEEEAHVKAYAELKGRIASCDSPESLPFLVGDLSDLANELIGRASEERSQVACFVEALKAALVEVEAQLQSSLADNRSTFQSNQSFSETLHGHMQGIQAAFSIGKTLEETRQFVFARLQTIKAVLEEKRRQDEAAFLSARQKMEDLQTHLDQMENEVSRVQERTKSLEKEILLDALTGIHNRKAYDQHILEEMQRFKRYGQVFSLVLFDVDRFKNVNDEYGHRAGDKCLKEIINRIKPALRTSDFLARYGGEEFVVVLTGTGAEGAKIVAEKLRRAIEVVRFVYHGQEIHVTISLGVAEVHKTDKSPESLFARADSALYRAKNEGRNRACAA